MFKNIYLVLLLFTLFSCESVIKKEKKAKGTENTSAQNENIQIRKKYNDEGRVVTEVPYRDNLKHGVAKHYYPSGKVSMEIPYVNNLKHGTSYYYYTNGSVYRTTPYINGQINGIRKKYYENGKLMAEIPYRNNEPIPGLKEWTEDGTLLTKYPDITFKEINLLNSNFKIILQIFFSDRSKKVKFYKKSINENNDTSRIALLVENGVVELEYYVPKGQQLNEKIEIVGIKETKRRNKFVYEKTYNLNVKN
ncbi:toxin-antitoxin system YwqK family antitoxin [Bacteroidota bacterium]